MSGADFAPPVWLRHYHLQSILPTSRVRRPWVLRHARTLLASSKPEILDCGEGVRLAGFHARQENAGRPAARRLVLLLHGWEGHAQSLYMLALGSRLFERGYDVFRLNFRDHGGSHGLNAGLFHSCRIDEVVGAAARLQALHPQQLIVGGFSLGGNFALRVAARATAAGITLERAFAICPVLSPHATLERLEHGWFIYRQYFITKWRRSLHLKQRSFPDLYDLKDILGLRTLTDMTDQMVRRYSEYPDLNTYLDGYALTGETLANLTVPSHVLLAEDDPIIPVQDAAGLARPDCLDLTISRFGGHCGFLPRFDGESWATEWLVGVLAADGCAL